MQELKCGCAEILSRVRGRSGWRATAGGAVLQSADGEVILSLEVAPGGEVRLAAPVVRPDAIGLEAELALRDLGLPGVDPAAFLQAWRGCNRAAIAHAVRDGAPRRSLPATVNERIWRWNRACEAYGDRLAAVEVVPCAPAPVRLVALPHDPVTVLTAVPWSDAAPIALPEVDLVLAADGPDSVPRAIPLVALLPWLERFPRREAGYRFGRAGVVHDAGLAHWIVDDWAGSGASPPSEGLADALRTLGAVRMLVPLAPGEVLDREQLVPVRPSAPTPGTRLPHAV